MATACSNLVTDVISRAGSLMTDFLPVLALVGGLALGMWVLSFLRGMFGGD